MTSQARSIEHIRRVLGQGKQASSSDFDLNAGTDSAWPIAKTLRPAAVLVPLIASPKGLNVILTKRASHLKHHPGQIAFPGGKVDEGDASVTSAALREADEEIGLPPETVDILGELPFHVTVTSFQVTPIVGHVTAPFDPKPEAGEVDEVFLVPLSYLAEPGNYRIEWRYWGGVKRRYYTVPFGPYYIWGATARMLRGLADRMAS